MKKTTLTFSLFTAMFSVSTLYAQVPVKPAHVVFVLEENYSYSDIIGSSYAPTLTQLSKDSTTCSFTQAYAITHPSEPNYLDLFSGGDHGVTVDETGPDASAPFNDCNLASSLDSTKLYTFIGYSETQPSVGWFVTDNPPYYTKHCPWINWMNGDNGNNAVKDSVKVSSDLPYAPIGTYFPDSLHYNNLPTVSWVIPNCSDDMHDPYVPSTAISNGDKWFNTNMMPLVRWANNYNNNTLIIVIWDEDDALHSNNIPLLFCGGIVKGGTCTTKVTHYDVLKTVEDMYGLQHCGASASGNDVPNSVWLITGVNSITAPTAEVTTWPVPATNQLNVKVSTKAEASVKIGLYDVTGRMVKEIPSKLTVGDNFLTVGTEDVANGVYFLNITGEKINISKKVSIQK